MMNVILSNPVVMRPAEPARPVFDRAEPGTTSLFSVATLVIWSSCAAIGLLGFALPYVRPHQPAPPARAMEVQMVNVELTDDAGPAPTSPAQFKSALAAPDAPPPVAVAEPSPAIAFALPVKSVAAVTDAQRAGFSAVPQNSAVSAPVQRITFGSGEGRQPAPDYPLRARREGQQGTVVVRLTVNEQGSVVTAEAVTPSPWPLLNESAVRTVKTRWNFSSGNLRVYEVPIAFVLSM